MLGKGKHNDDTTHLDGTYAQGVAKASDTAAKMSLRGTFTHGIFWWLPIQVV